MADGGLPPIETYLRSGQAFYGYQTNLPFPLTLNVMITAVDLGRGVMSGTMERSITPDENDENAGLVSEALPPINWMIRIINNHDFGFLHDPWTGSPATELIQWDQFPVFYGFREEVQFNNGRSLNLGSYPYTFMKMKESSIGHDRVTSFPTWYFLSMSRRLGEINGKGYNPRNSWVSNLRLLPL